MKSYVMYTTATDWDTDDLTTTEANYWVFDEQIDNFISLFCYLLFSYFTMQKINYINTMKAAKVLSLK